jgi:hypothetical protein
VQNVNGTSEILSAEDGDEASAADKEHAPTTDLSIPDFLKRPLVVFEEARREIADASTTNQVKRILAMATGLAAAARKADRSWFRGRG